MSEEIPHDTGSDRESDSARFGELEHVTEFDDRSVRCTVFPQDCDDEQLVTHWITADAASFVSLARMQ